MDVFSPALGGGGGFHNCVAKTYITSLSSLKHSVIAAKKGFTSNSHHNRIQLQIISVGFLPALLINSSWLHSLESTFPMRSSLRISLYCTRSCYWEEFLCPMFSLHLRKRRSINAPRDVREICAPQREEAIPEEECLRGLKCEKGPQPLDIRHCPV